MALARSEGRLEPDAVMRGSIRPPCHATPRRKDGCHWTIVQIVQEERRHLHTQSGERPAVLGLPGVYYLWPVRSSKAAIAAR
jgi:hypothetical protein